MSRPGGLQVGCFLLLAALMLAAAGSGASTAPTSASPRAAAVLSPWPSAADYTTIKVAAAVRDHALFHERDWRRKAFAARLGLRTLLTVRMAPGPCATFVNGLYANLRDMLDAYRGEDWRPLYVVVRREVPLWFACQPPRRPGLAG